MTLATTSIGRTPYHVARTPGRTGAPRRQSAATAPRTVDRVELSSLGRTRRDIESRNDRIARIRAEIQAGVYDTEERLDLAIDAMLDDL